MNKLTITAATIFILAGCSSTPKNSTPENMPDKVFSRINDLSSRPEWLNEEKPFEFKNSNVVFLGQTTIPGDNRVEAAYMIAENNAKGAICRAIAAAEPPELPPGVRDVS